MGIAAHLINTAKFLSENYNTHLAVKSATLITIEKTNSILDFMKKVQSVLDIKSSKKNWGDSIPIEGNKSLEEELVNLENMERLDGKSLDEKNNFMRYVKHIGQISENIVLDANFIIVKSK